MTELRHLQLVILSIAKDLDALCRANHIDYYLNGGSAIGAIRHQGFIPWDDDLDIMMTHDNYRRFIRCCREQLDPEKYYVQEGLRDWPLNYTKIKLRGTRFTEREGYVKNPDMQGIFIDVFPIDNTTANHLLRHWQYACAKYRVCYGMLQRTYRSASWPKKVAIALSWPMKWASLRRFVEHQATRYNHQPTEWVASFYESKRYARCFFRRTTFGTPRYVPFEDTELPVPADCDTYLRTCFDDYMQLPPKEEQQLKHMLDIDFGQY